MFIPADIRLVKLLIASDPFQDKLIQYLPLEKHEQWRFHGLKTHADALWQSDKVIKV
jgi:hypothetical protein